jgi:putative hydrolase of the HAD superfamily
LLPYIFLDATGTLFRLTESVGTGYARISKTFGFHLDPDATDAAFRSTFATIQQPVYPNGPDEHADRLWWKEFVHRVFTTAGENPDQPIFTTAGENPDQPTFDDCFNTLFDFYGKAEAWQLFPDTLPALEQLTSHGFELAVLSNFDQRLHGILDALGVRSHFRHIIISSEIAATKPHPDAFLAAAKRVARSASDCILIGDDPLRDHKGALAAGFRSAHLVDRPNSDLKTIANSLIQSVSG